MLFYERVDPPPLKLAGTNVTQTLDVHLGFPPEG